MRTVLSRVSHASASNLAESFSKVEANPSLCLLIGFHKNDTAEKVKAMANKIGNLRIFDDEDDQGELLSGEGTTNNVSSPGKSSSASSLICDESNNSTVTTGTDQGTKKKRWTRSLIDLATSDKRSVSNPVPKNRVLVISNYTLYAKIDKGTKPDFHDMMPSEQARTMNDLFCDELNRLLGYSVTQGKFGENFLVEMTQTGIVNMILEN